MKPASFPILLGLVAGLGLPHAVAADEVLDTIEAARAAYEAGNIQDAAEELSYAQQLMREMQTAGLTEFLPAPPDGWTRDINTNIAAAMAMLGGGVGAEATYASSSGSFNVTLMAGNPMVEAFAGMLGETGLSGAGERVDVGGAAFVNQDGELTGLIGGRILVQASGAPLEAMLPVLQAIDFAAMAAFGS